MPREGGLDPACPGMAYFHGMESMEAFANRLTKMARHFGRWARRQGITCYRIYDADLTGYPLAIDRYGPWVHISEYQRGFEEDDTAYGSWKSEVLTLVAATLDVPPGHLFYKERRPQKGSAQYEKRGERGRERVVEEGGLQFLVNLEDYLDTGLFLDHRITRGMVREASAGKKVLNLFAYTGSFTVYAAAGGAAETLTLDLSQTYLDWTRRNMALNGFEGPGHQIERADVPAWLQEKPRGAWDIIILDPPTFSNSKMMRSVLDLQRDYPELIAACMLRLRPGGVLYFSTNFRGFRLRQEALPGWVQVREISGQTIPPDFRNKKIHQCWLINGISS
jgi:23S rRNA (cytosine1962-C5)-methyltransferase